MFSVCVCVFWRSLCSKFWNWETILRDFCVVWIIGWVVCWIAFISVFFTSRKTVLKNWLDTSSTPPRYHAICRASQAFFLTQSRHLLDTWWIDRENSCLLDTWWIDRASVLESDSLFLDTSTVDDQILDTYLNSFLDTSAVEHYWRIYIFLLCDPSLISSIFLDMSVIVHLPNTLIFTPNLFLKDSSSFFKFLFT